MSRSEVAHGRPRIFPDGTIAYPKRGWEPPPVPESYRRKVANLRSPDAWIFIPILDDCEHRTQNVTYTACGACKLTYHCKLFGPVKPPQCQRCEES